MNLRDLLLKTRDLLDERTTTTGAPQWADYQLRRWLSEAQYDLVLRDPRAFPELLTESTSTATTSGTSDYALPADFLDLHGVVLGGVPCRIVTRGGSYASARDSWAPTFSDPEVEVIDGEDVRFYPTPDSTVPTWSAFYYRRPLELHYQIATFEDNEAWTVSGAGASIADTTTGTSTEEETIVSGAQSSEGQQMTVTLGNTGTLAYVLPAAVDLGTDTTDVIEIWVSTNQTNLTNFQLQFHTTAGTAYYTATVLPAAFAANGAFVRVPKSLFTAGAGSPSWASIAEIRIVQVSGGGGSSVVTYDDWRIYRTPEIDPAVHVMLPSYAAARALMSDLGQGDGRDGANLMADWERWVGSYLGKAG